MSLSQLARSISESPTLKLNETAALLREKGEPVIHLGRRRAEEQGAHRRHRQLRGAAQHRRREVHSGGRHPGAQEGHHPLHRRALRPPAGGGERDRLERRQAVHHGAAARHPRSQGGSHLPRAVLGQLSGDGEARRRRARAGDGAQMAASSRPSKRSPRPSALTPRPSSSTAPTTPPAWCTRTSSSPAWWSCAKSTTST